MTNEESLLHLPIIEEEAAKGIENIRRLRGHTLPTIQRKPWPKTHRVLGKGAAGIVYESTTHGSDETFAAKVINVDAYERRMEGGQDVLARPIWMSSDPLLANISMNLPFAYSGHIAKETEHFSTWSRQHPETVENVFYKVGYNPEALQNAIHWFFPKIVAEYAKVHEAGYVICDIKPGNILAENANPILADLDSFRLDVYNPSISPEPKVNSFDPRTPRYASRRSLEDWDTPMKQEDDVEATAVMLADLAFNLKDALPVEQFDQKGMLLGRELFCKDSYFGQKGQEMGMPNLYPVLVEGVQGKILTMRDLQSRIEEATRANY